jgi:adenine/guanine phosphoribosyltransferase-like PRPP-binding protein
MQQIIKAFHHQPLVFLKDRKYIVNPLCDHCPATTYELVDDVVKELSKLIDFGKATKIIGEEDRGGFVAALIAYYHKLPFGLVKWNAAGLDGQIYVPFRNAYAEGKMYLNGAEQGDKVIVVEDIIDSGGTIIAMINLLKKAKIKIIDIVAIAEKVEYKGVERIRQETGFYVKHLIKVASNGGDLSKVVWVKGRKVTLS